MVVALLCAALVAGAAAVPVSAGPPQPVAWVRNLGISFDAATRIFRLDGPRSTYAFRATESGLLEHLHWGPAAGPSDDLGFLAKDSRPADFDAGEKNYRMLEFADFGTGDFRTPTLALRHADGNEISPFQYRSHTVHAGKPAVDGSQPELFADDGSAQTLCVELEDPLKGVEVQLWYTIFVGTDVVTRRTVVANGGASTTTITAINSATIDFPMAEDYTMMQLSGAWSRERSLVERKIDFGTTSIGSMRGASSHQHNPLVVLTEGGFHEDRGNHWALNLVYSGNFLAEIECVQTARLRASIGIHPARFAWQLAPNATFASPEVVLAFSDAGMGDVSRQMHRVYRQHLMRSAWANRLRPIKVNSWEAMYFAVTHDRVMELLAEPAAELGLDLVVLDDGWFGNRTTGRCCLGDWEVNPDKFPHGLAGLANDINALGLDFGIWMEPEMISPDSNLYRAHPDWALQTEGREGTRGRNQLVLDLTRDEIRDWVVQAVANVLGSANITYLKWDVNRHLTEVSSAHLGPDRQGEVYHRFILGVYDVMDRITAQFPNVLFESCSGGGGRYDPAMLYYMPQTWASDNTDTISRSMIQYGTSLAYPTISMGAHISSTPNHQTRRSTSLQSRALMAMGGVFGFELNLAQLDALERAQVSAFVETYHEIQATVLQGNMYRLATPGRGSMTAWMFVDDSQAHAVVFAFNTEFFEPVVHFPRLRLAGLREDARYTVDELDGAAVHGSTLMGAGLPMEFWQDAGSFMARVDLVEEQENK